MLFYTHLAFSILGGIYFIEFFPVKSKILFFFMLILFASLPDIDTSKSKIGRKTGIFSKIINFFFGHRGLFHSLLFIMVGYLLLYFLPDKIFALAFLVGFSSHLILDAMTHEGIMPFYPLKYKVNGIVKTGGFLEILILILIVLLAAVKLIGV